MKRNLTKLLSVGLLCLSLYAFGQQKPITGKVVDSNNYPVQDAYVYVEGTDNGVYTDGEGFYTIEAKKGDVIKVEFIGFDTKDIKVNDANKYNVKLSKGGAVELKALVATALGIEKNEKSLGYAVSSLDSKELTVAKDPNIVNNLAGKASGVNIMQQSGTVGGASKIILRGATSLGGDNQPLFVIDGLPLNNDYVSNGLAGAVDYGGPLTDIDPESIEKINILKGAAATALYGARAKNGAIIITTKRGGRGKVVINYSTNIRFDNVAKLPDYQNQYAQGSNGKYHLDNFNGWGPKISDVKNVKFENFLGEDVYLKAYPNNVRNFFNTGLTLINSFSLSGGDVDSDLRLGYTNTRQSGIVPQSTYKNNNITFNTGRKLNELLSIRVSGTYSRSLRDGLPVQSSNDPNIVVGSILTMPRTTNIKKLREYVYDEKGNQNFWDGKKVNNPYFIIDNNKVTSDVERFYGNAQLELKPLSWLTIKNKIGIDFSTDSRRTLYVLGTAGEIDGRFKDGAYRNRVINNDFTISLNREVTPDLEISILLGHNTYQKEYERRSNDAKKLIAKNLFTYSNAKVNVPTNYYYIKRIHGLFSEVSLSYDKKLYLTLTGRNDWTSTLPKENNSYFYPSVSLSYVFSEDLKQNWLDYGKVRLNWANVGSDEEPYQLNFLYYPASTWYSQFGAGGTFPFGGVNAFEIPRTYPNVNLKPQNQVSYEGGVELQMFKNRLRFNSSYYYIDTKDQIVSIDVPVATGYFTKVVNAGLIRNKGFEIELGITPIRTTDWNWDLNFNFSKNKTTVEYLDGVLEDYTLTSGWSGLVIKATPGKSFSLYGKAWRRDDKGQYIIDSKTGLRETISNQNLGSIDPDFRLGFVNNLRYKNISLNFVIDWKQGGKMFSGTAASLRSSGLVKETLAHRGEKFIEKGVNEVKDLNGKVSYVQNKTPVASMQEYWTHTSSTTNTEENVFDATYMKLRSVSLSYIFPKSYFSSNSVLKGAIIGIEGRNLWNIIDNVPYVDPELNFFGPSVTGGGVEFNSIPLTRSFGMSVKLNF